MIDGIKTNGSEVEMVDAHKKKKSSSITLLLIVGLNIGLLLMAGLIGAMCYAKKSAGSPQFYSKVPGMYECHMGGLHGSDLIIFFTTFARYWSMFSGLKPTELHSTFADGR